MSGQKWLEKPFAVEIAKWDRACCKKCKEKCPEGALRYGKLVKNSYNEKAHHWHHLNCLFEVFATQKVTKVRLTDPEEDLEGWDKLDSDVKEEIFKKIDECNQLIWWGQTPDKKSEPTPSTSATTPKVEPIHKDNSFREFRRLVADITNVDSYLEKTALVNTMFTKGSDGEGFKGDIVLWCRLLLPGSIKRNYNLQSKQLVKLFSRIFGTDHDAMLEHLEQGDVSDTIQEYFEKGTLLKPAYRARLTMEQVDNFLEELSKTTTEDNQAFLFKKFASRCTSNELKVVIRLIKHDLRMKAGAKHILQGVYKGAYPAYQSSLDLAAVIKKRTGVKKPTINLMTPVLPMLADACKSVEQAMKKCPNGMYSEIKYDGERVQVHKQGSEFKYFSRSLKPVLPHKIAHFQKYIPQAFPHGKDLILDSEILLMDTHTGKPLPFGTLGVHKKSAFADATVCLIVFDCIYYNGEILSDKPLQHRKKVLQETMIEIPHHIVFSEMEEIHDPSDLTCMIAKVLKLGLEGLVLKDLKGAYEPGKRHWLKVKKDYLFGGAMADTADLIVLGAWFGTGKKGGMMSVFLMGCYDSTTDSFRTVTKVHTGHNDNALKRLQDDLDMVKISKDQSQVPSWLRCTRTMVPDFVARDPKKQPVWEITGAEFTRQHEVHTAGGISIRFPRVTREREDKDWTTATSLAELEVLCKNSKDNIDVGLLMPHANGEPSGSSPIKREIESPVRELKRVKIESPAREFKRVKIESAVRELKTVQIENPLPDYFTGVQVFLDDGVWERHSDILRHFVAYGGEFVKDATEASYVIHLVKEAERDDRFLPTVKHVTWNWVNACIAEKRLCDWKFYAVSLKPPTM